MKLLFRLSFLVLIPIIVGLALLLSGYSIGAWILEIGTPAVLIILVIVGLIMYLKGMLFEKPSKNNNTNSAAATPENATELPVANEINSSQDGKVNCDECTENNQDSETNNEKPSEKAREQAAINAVNDSAFYSSKVKLAEYEAQQVAEGMKNTSKKGCAFVIIVVLLVIIDVALAVVFTIKHIWVGTIVCAALFAVTIITGLITAAIRQAKSMHGDIKKAKKFVCGKVKSCIMSSMTTSEVNKSERINGVVYNVIVSADDAEYSAFSKQFYETDEKIVVAVMGKKLSKIVEESDLEYQSDEIKNKYNECLTTGKAVTIKQTYTPSGHSHRTHRRH